MKILFDTSVLVAAILSGHSRHSVCLPLLLKAQAQQNQGLISTHALAELYSALTRIPQAKITPTLAQDLIRETIPTLQEYLLIDSEKISAECYRRGEGRMWLYSPYTSGDAITLESLGISLEIEQLYAGISFGFES